MSSRIILFLLFSFALFGCKKPQAKPRAQQSKAPAFASLDTEGKLQTFGKPWRGIHLFVFFRGDW